jgi:cysteine peptidase A
VTVTNWHRLADEQAMIDYVLAKGTLSVVVDATLWGPYRSGIFSNCGSTPSINHAVNIVGVNVDEGYWIIRNSWGTWWGDKGYMKLALVSINASLSHSYYLITPQQSI